MQKCTEAAYPGFSVVITTYNRLALLGRAIDSALQQTVPCEVVVVDDCCDDGTAEYMQSRVAELHAAGDHRLIYHRNAVNSGHSESMNQGVTVASGEWIKPLDDDDYLAPDCLEEMQKAIDTYNLQVRDNPTHDRQSQVVICSCRAAQVDPDQNEIGKTRVFGPGKVFCIPQVDIHFGMLLDQVPFGTPAQVAYRRDAFIESGGWDSYFDVNCDDIDSWIRIAELGDAIFLNQCLAYRTVWPGAYNQTFPYQTRLETNIKMKEKIYPLIHDKYRQHLPKFSEIEHYLGLHWAFVALKRANVVKAFQIATPASLFSLSAWKLLIGGIATRQCQQFSIPLQSTDDSQADYLSNQLQPDQSELSEQQVRYLRELEIYTLLHQGLRKVQNGKVQDGLKQILPFSFSLTGWKLLISILLSYDAEEDFSIQKLVLIE
ncbi:MAG: glycosyltransferase family 2 protein [Microcoleaceae cyanobacterium]